MCEWLARTVESFWTTGRRHSKLSPNTFAFGLRKPRRNKTLRENAMRMKYALQSGVAVNAIAAAALALSLSAGAAQAQQPSPAQNASQVAIDSDDIGGVVTGPDGPEAGVWVIAETTDLPTTKLAKTVVTDDAGRYLVPDLPKAKYKVWVRGYGLVDSAEGRRRARPAAQSDGREGAERRGRRTILSSDLLVLDAARSRIRASSAAKPTSRKRSRKPNGCEPSRTKRASAAIRSANSGPGQSRRHSAPARTAGCGACSQARRRN